MANWTIEPQPFGANHAPLLTGLSNVDGLTPVPIAVDPANGQLQVAGGGGGTQYTDGGTPPAHPIGNAIEFNNSGTWATVSNSNPLPVSASITPASGVVSAGNSTTTPLTSGSTFTGTGTSVLGYSIVEVIVYSDQNSASGGLLIEFSSDNTNWDDSSPWTFTSGSAGPNQGQSFIAGVRGQYVRVVYTNGGTGQTTFRLQTVLKPTTVNGDIVSVNQGINANNHAAITNSQIFGLSTAGGGTYVPVKVTPSGAVTSAVTAADGDVYVRSNAASTFPVNANQSGTWNITNISGTVSLPTGAATSANQTNGSQKSQIVDGSNVTIPSTTTPTVNGNVVGLNTAPTYASSDFWPFYNNMSIGGGQPHVDPAGALITRGAVTTDEGTARANFTGSSLTNSIGTATFTNGSATVTGTGFTTIDLHYTQFVKLAADSETAWAEVAFINSDTQLTLFTAYTGTGGTGTGSVSQVATKTGTGATISVASGQMTIASGTNSSATTYVYIPAADGSIIGQTSASISQRIANQDIYIGLEASAATPTSFARFHFSGTDNTKVITETGYNPTTTPSSSEMETNTITLPNSATTASANTYRIEQQAEQIIFSINGAIVASHTKRIPHIVYEGQNAFVYDIKVVASGTVTTTSIVVDYMLSRNFDRIDVLQSPVSSIASSGQTITTLPTAAAQGALVNISADKFGRQVTIAQGTRDIVTDNTVTISASTSETTILSAVASTFLDLTAVTVSNTSATATRVDFRDATSGTVRFSLYVPAGDVRGMVLNVPRPQTAVNNNWTAQSSASVTDLRVWMQAVKNQ